MGSAGRRRRWRRRVLISPEAGGAEGSGSRASTSAATQIWGGRSDHSFPLACCEGAAASRHLRPQRVGAARPRAPCTPQSAAIVSAPLSWIARTSSRICAARSQLKRMSSDTLHTNVGVLDRAPDQILLRLHQRRRTASSGAPRRRARAARQEAPRHARVCRCTTRSAACAPPARSRASASSLPRAARAGWRSRAPRAAAARDLRSWAGWGCEEGCGVWGGRRVRGEG